ncbi:MAG: hypothetical protein R2797_07180 [Gelidibacter sp.]
MSYLKPKKFRKYVFWIFKRHPYLYFTRFRLLSKNVSESDINQESYNLTNKSDDIPKIFFEVNKLIFLPNEELKDIDKMKKLSMWLVDHIKGGPGLSLSSQKALEIMLAGKGGVCSDMAQIFNNFCIINNLMVREWGVTLIPFDTNFGGHSFNEVFSKELNKWIFVDVSNCLLFYSDFQDRPLSVIELYDLVRKKKFPKAFFFNKENKFKEKIINDYYFNVQAAPFLICSYSTKTYDFYLEKLRPFVPVFIIHFFILFFGKSYSYKFPMDNYKLLFS